VQYRVQRLVSPMVDSPERQPLVCLVLRLVLQRVSWELIAPATRHLQARLQVDFPPGKGSKAELLAGPLEAL
jgi:hypothetical protein